jgi:hypothetical protein
MRFRLVAGVAVAAAFLVNGAAGAFGGPSGGSTSAPAIDLLPAPPVANPFVSAPPDVVVSENVGFVDLTVSLSAPGLNTVSVDWILDDGTATGGPSATRTTRRIAAT